MPSGDLTWGQTYYWTVQDYDGVDTSTSGTTNYFSTPVPQPLVTSGLSQNENGPGYDAGSGDYTTSSTDAQVPTTGPALEITRDYNSQDPRLTGAFGAGWSSVLDMKVAPGQNNAAGTTATEVVTYPDGEEVAFGLTSSGAYVAPPGRYATLAAVTGGFTLTDKNDTVYTFKQALTAGGYGITSIADALGHTETFTWTSSSPFEITQITSASGRTLALTWVPAAPSGAPFYPHVSQVVTQDVTPGADTTALTWQYNYSGDELTSVCPPADSVHCTTYAYKSGSDYPESVLDSGPASYWRLDEASGATAASSVMLNEGTDNATYSGATLGTGTGPLAGSSATPAAFDGTSSEVTLPQNLVSGASYQSVSMWFNTTTPNGVLFSYQNSALSAGTTTGSYTPSLYIGSDGKLYGQFWQGGIEPDGDLGGGHGRQVAPGHADGGGQHPDPVPGRRQGDVAGRHGQRLLRGQRLHRCRVPRRQLAQRGELPQERQHRLRHLLQRRHLGRGVLDPPADRQRGEHPVRCRDPPGGPADRGDPPVRQDVRAGQLRSAHRPDDLGDRRQRRHLDGERRRRWTAPARSTWPRCSATSRWTTGGSATPGPPTR